MKCVEEAPKVSQNKDLKQTNAEPSAKTADPANFFLVFTLNCVRFFKTQYRHISQAF